MESSIQYLLELDSGPRPIWPKAQHLRRWLSTQDAWTRAWPRGRRRDRGLCPRQLRDEPLPSCSLLGQWVGLGSSASLRSGRPAQPSGS